MQFIDFSLNDITEEIKKYGGEQKVTDNEDLLEFNRGKNHIQNIINVEVNQGSDKNNFTQVQLQRQEKMTSQPRKAQSKSEKQIRMEKEKLKEKEKERER